MMFQLIQFLFKQTSIKLVQIKDPTRQVLFNTEQEINTNKVPFLVGAKC